MRAKMSRDNRGYSMYRSYSHVGKHTTKYKCSTIYGIFKREKQLNDI